MHSIKCECSENQLELTEKGATIGEHLITTCTLFPVDSGYAIPFHFLEK